MIVKLSLYSVVELVLVRTFGFQIQFLLGQFVFVFLEKTKKAYSIIFFLELSINMNK